MWSCVTLDTTTEEIKESQHSFRASASCHRLMSPGGQQRLALGSACLASARSVHIALVVRSWSFETHTHTRSHVGARRQTHHVKLSYRIKKKIKIKGWGRAEVSWRGCTNVPHWWMFRNYTTLRKSPWKSCEGRGWSPPKFRSSTCPTRMPAAWRLVPHRFQRPDVWTHEM